MHRTPSSVRVFAKSLHVLAAGWIVAVGWLWLAGVRQSLARHGAWPDEDALSILAAGGLPALALAATARWLGRVPAGSERARGSAGMAPRLLVVSRAHRDAGGHRMADDSGRVVTNGVGAAGLVFEEWVAALERRHLADLTFAEVSRALRALSATYVERRGAAEGAALSGAGKRAAFAMFYGPLHFLLVREVVRALEARSLRAPASDHRGPRLWHGRGRRGVGERAGGHRPLVHGIDRSAWALAEAEHTWRAFGIPAGPAVRISRGGVAGRSRYARCRIRGQRAQTRLAHRFSNGFSRRTGVGAGGKPRSGGHGAPEAKPPY